MLYDDFPAFFDQIDCKCLDEQAGHDDEEDLQLHIGSGGVKDLERDCTEVCED